MSTSSVVSCQLRARSVSAWTLSTMRLMLLFDGRWPKRALPVVGEYIRPNVYPRKSNSPSGILQIRVFSSFTVSFSLPMISRRWCRAFSALPLRHMDHKVIRIIDEASAEALLKAELLPPQHKPAHVQRRLFTAHADSGRSRECAGIAGVG